MRTLRHKPGRCVLCEDWSQGSVGLEADLAASRYETMARHVEPGICGIRTKGQYQRLLRSRGLTDDLPTKEILDRANDTGYRERIREAQFQQVTQRAMEVARRTIAESPVRPVPRTDQQRALLRQVERAFGH